MKESAKGRFFEKCLTAAANEGVGSYRFHCFRVRQPLQQAYWDRGTLGIFMDYLILCPSYFSFAYPKIIYNKYSCIRTGFNPTCTPNIEPPFSLFSKNLPLADSFIESRCLSIYLSVYIYVPFHVIFFEASHWPSGHMIRSRPLIGRPRAATGVGIPKNSLYTDYFHDSIFLPSCCCENNI